MRFIKSFLLVILVSFFITGISSVANASESININEASYEELQKIKGVGKVIAQRIVEERPYHSLDDLIRVKGIGEATLRGIKSQGLAYRKPSFEGHFPARIIDIFESSSIANSVAESLNKSINDLATKQELETVYFVRADSSRHPIAYSLSGVQYLSELSSLYVSDNKLENLNELDGFEHLVIDARDNQIIDISGLKNLKVSDHINLIENKIDSINDLANLAEVNHLFLQNNNISDLSPLSNAKNILAIGLTGNPITSLAPLKNVNFWAFYNDNNYTQYNYFEYEADFSETLTYD